MFALAVTVFLAWAVSFTCSLLEACFLSLSVADIASISEKNARIGMIWRGFKERLQRPIGVILIINTLANAMGAAISGALFNEMYGPHWLLLFSLGFSYLVIQWGEILPKTLGVRFNRQIAAVAATPMKMAVKILGPVVAWFEFMNRPFLSQARKKGVNVQALDDINLLARFALVNNLITKEQQDIVARSITLSQLKVSDIMIERSNLKFLSSTMSMMDGLIEAHIHHHTRYPLIREKNIDKIIGFVNVKDIISAMRLNPRNPSLEGIARPVMTIKPDELVSALLKKLTKGYQHMAVVVDDNDVTVGLVTLEDVTEALIGDVQDEYDLLPTYAYPLCEGRYLAGGGISMHDLRAKTGMEIPDERALLNDWLFSRLPGVPRVEMKVSLGGINYIVRKIKRANIYEAIVEDVKMAGTPPCPPPKAEA